MHEHLRKGAQGAFQRIEEVFDRAFAGADNPLRHLGAMGLYFLWLMVVTGIYLYIVLDTSVAGVYSSIGQLSQGPWAIGGVLRSIHRYSADGFIVVMALHVLREWAYGHFFGFRFYSWITGVPLIWLAYVSGIGGYWIVWDVTAQYSATATVELFDWLPIFSEPAARNFLRPESIYDRFFTVLVFVHLAVPLLLLLGLWAHVNRISKVDYLPSRRTMFGTLACLLLLASVKPALSGAAANLAVVPDAFRLDWWILFLNPLTDVSSAPVIWTALFAITVLLFALPFLPHPAAQALALVDAPNCNGCSRCHVDCPYEAITMVTHPEKPAHKLAVVDPDLCASCGICAGSCPSSTPFRSQQRLVTGIDMPQQPVDRIRQELERALAELKGPGKLVVFGCDHGANLQTLQRPDTMTLSLLCAGMLPPSFIEYALRGGAEGVVVTGCREGGCDYRLGMRWSQLRLYGKREPHLRSLVPAERVLFHPASSNDLVALAAAIDTFRTRLGRPQMPANPPVFHRRTPHHG